MPLPDRDFDPTEAAVTWSVIEAAGHDVVFATEHCTRPAADPIMISGERLDPWGFIPGIRKLKLIGLALRAQQGARDAYAAMQKADSFTNPIRYSDLEVADLTGSFFPAVTVLAWCSIWRTKRSRGLSPTSTSQVTEHSSTNLLERSATVSYSQRGPLPHPPDNQCFRGARRPLSPGVRRRLRGS